MRDWLIAGGLAVAVVLMLSAAISAGVLPPDALGTIPPTIPTLAADCTNTPAVVQAYRAPGQNRPVGPTLTDKLRAEGRPVGPGTWHAYSLGAAGCAAEYRVSIGNEIHALRWEVDRSGRVQAHDPLTRRLSGW